MISARKGVNAYHTRSAPAPPYIDSVGVCRDLVPLRSVPAAGFAPFPCCPGPRFVQRAFEQAGIVRSCCPFWDDEPVEGAPAVRGDQLPEVRAMDSAPGSIVGGRRAADVRSNPEAMISSEVQRTLVKSPPELWAELSDPAALARHLGELGEIRIVRTSLNASSSGSGAHTAFVPRSHPDGEQGSRSAPLVSSPPSREVAGATLHEPAEPNAGEEPAKPDAGGEPAKPNAGEEPAEADAAPEPQSDMAAEHPVGPGSGHDRGLAVGAGAGAGS